MSLPDRASSLVDRILSSRETRSERRQAIRERAALGQRQASYLLKASSFRWEQLRRHAHDLIQELERNRAGLLTKFAALHGPVQTKRASTPFEPAPPRVVPVRPAPKPTLTARRAAVIEQVTKRHYHSSHREGGASK